MNEEKNPLVPAPSLYICRHFGTKCACDKLVGERVGRSRAEMEAVSKEEENFIQSEI